jgi:endonuclease III
MKRGSEYAKRLKQLYQQLVRQYGKPDPAPATDPLEQLLTGILSICSSDSKARSAYQRLVADMVDLNELRVTPSMELADLIGDGLPLRQQKAEWIVMALNEIRLREDTLDLSFLAQRGRREARDYLESLPGVDRSAAASVVLFSLGGHAIPVDDLTVYVLRKDEVIDEDANAGEVQGFLERNISASDCTTFATLLNRHVAQKGSRVAIEKLPELLNLQTESVAAPPKQEEEPVETAVEGTAASEKAASDGASKRKSAKEKSPATKAASKKSAESKSSKAAKASKPAKAAKAAGAGSTKERGSASKSSTGKSSTKSKSSAKPRSKKDKKASTAKRKTSSLRKKK